MKSTLTLPLLLAFACFFQLHPAFGQFETLKKRIKETTGTVLDETTEQRVDKLISRFEKGQPISTSFDDAIYEADFLGNFEPAEGEYRPLDLQPKEGNCGFRLRSGFYTMNAKSFCLRGYTHGPSKGDGHLYAPLKGKKADFVQSIIEHYGAKPEIPQRDVQVLLWAVIAGADMNTLGEQHAKTLNALFTTEELLVYTGKDWLNGVGERQVDEFKRTIIGNTPPQLQALLDADDKIRSMVKANKSFQEIEQVAIIAGVAPRDMIREVSKGRWSYHPDGFFVRFFPNGYPQTRVDVYVPFQDAVQTDAKGKAIGLNKDAKQPKEVIFKPCGMVASPANRPSQRIGVSPVPVNDISCIEAIISKLTFNSPIKNLPSEVDCSKRKVDWVDDSKLISCKPFSNKFIEFVEYGNIYNKSSSDFHCYYVENEVCDISTCSNCTLEKVFNLMISSANYIAPTDSKLPVTNCSVTNVNIPCIPNNPIVTTIHPEEKAIINYTVAYQETVFAPSGEYQRLVWHFLHPGKVQRKIFKDGTKIKVATLGEGSGWLKDENLIYALRTWGAVDNRLKASFICK